MANRVLHPSRLGPRDRAPAASTEPAEADPDSGTDPEPSPDEEAAEEGTPDPRQPGPYNAPGARDRSHLRLVPNPRD